MSTSSSHPTKKKRKQSTSDDSKLIEEFKYKENNCDVLEETQPSSEIVSHESEMSSKSKKKKKKSKKRHNSEDANESKGNITKESTNQPESDSDIPKKNRKRKYIEGTGDQNDLQDSTSYNESYLDLRVKQENAMSTSSFHPTKKKRKQSTSDDSKLIEEFKYKENYCDVLEETQPSSEIVSHESEVSSKSKKKKKKSKKLHNSEDANESKRNITEESRKQHNTSNNNIRNTSATDNNTFQNESSCEDISAISFDGDENVHYALFNDGQTEKDNLHKSTLISQFKSSHNYDGDISQEEQCEDSDDPDVEIEVPMGARLANLALDVNSRGKSAVSQNLTKLLMQGLYSKDKGIILMVLKKDKPGVALRTVSNLSADYVPPLLEQLAEMASSKTSQCASVCTWLSAVVRCHSALLLATMGSRIYDHLTRLLAIFTHRRSHLCQLLNLKGRLDLTITQRSQEQDPVLDYNDTSSDEELEADAGSDSCASWGDSEHSETDTDSDND